MGKNRKVSDEKEKKRCMYNLYKIPQHVYRVHTKKTMRVH